MRSVVGMISQPEIGQGPIDPFGGLICSGSSPSQPEADVFPHGGHDDLRVRIGEAEADQPAYGSALPPGVVTVHEHPTDVGDDETIEQPRECGLTRTVGADDAHPRLAHGDGHIAQDLSATRTVRIAVGDADHLDQRHASTTVATPWPPPTAIAARP